ncbi:MAG: Asp23/Gls24 family envelope stress response protein [Mogibacterium sp.]|nr:Asp23/Gls24 family envelope stress response protein [Mogibacterium sp.]
MSVIVRNSFGAIAVNKGVIERMIIEDMLSMDSLLMLSDKRGKPIKEKPTPIIDPDYYDAVEVSQKKDQVVKVKIFIVVKNGKNISEVADKVFEAVEKDFDTLRLQKPAVINVKVRGIAGEMNGVIVKRNIDIVRNSN